MKVKKVKCCPNCQEVLPEKGEELIQFMCGECEEVYEDREDAMACCKE